MDIILEGLRAMLFGMTGIFIVMGIIIGAVYFVNFISKKQKTDQEN